MESVRQLSELSVDFVNRYVFEDDANEAADELSRLLGIAMKLGAGEAVEAIKERINQ